MMKYLKCSWQWISWIFGETNIFEMEQSEMN